MSGTTWREKAEQPRRGEILQHQTARMNPGDQITIRILGEEGDTVRFWRHWVQDLKRPIPCLGPLICNKILLPDGQPLHRSVKAQKVTRILIWNYDTKKVEIFESGGNSLYNTVLGWYASWGAPNTYDIIVRCIEGTGEFPKNYTFAPARTPRGLSEEDQKMIRDSTPIVRAAMRPPKMTKEEIENLFLEAGGEESDEDDMPPYEDIPAEFASPPEDDIPPEFK